MKSQLFVNKGNIQIVLAVLMVLLKLLTINKINRTVLNYIYKLSLMYELPS